MLRLGLSGAAGTFIRRHLERGGALTALGCVPLKFRPFDRRPVLPRSALMRIPMRHRVMGTALPLLSPRLLDRKDAASRSIDKRLLLKGEQTCKGHDGRLQPASWAEALKAIEACVVLTNASRIVAIAGDLADFEEI